MEIEFEYPLRWPKEQPRTKKPEAMDTEADTEIQGNTLFLKTALKKLGTKKCVISWNKKQASSNNFYRENPQDPGVVLYLDLNGKNRVIAFDRWNSPDTNFHALCYFVEMIEEQKVLYPEAWESLLTGFDTLPKISEISTQESYIHANVRRASTRIEFGHPLYWPKDQPRTKKVERLKTKNITDIKSNHPFFHSELVALGIRKCIVNSNVQNGKDDFFSPEAIEDPGVVFYLNINKKIKVIAFDKWDTPAKNFSVLVSFTGFINHLDSWGGSGCIVSFFSKFELSSEIDRSALPKMIKSHPIDTDEINVREYREKHGLSRKQFASVLNISDTPVGNWERGDNRPVGKSLLALKTLFELSSGIDRFALPEMLKPNSVDTDEINVREYREKHGISRCYTSGGNGLFTVLRKL